ncbi:putative 26K protein [Pyrrhocoris apterus virus 1]|nr:putative 26K protein [Pyrrhocoris apterus virus 1]
MTTQNTTAANFETSQTLTANTGDANSASGLQQKTDNVHEGGALKKGGQKFHELLKDAIILCYTNLTNSPTLLSIYVFVWVVSAAEILNISNGPLEQWLKYLNENKGTWTLGVWLNSLQVWILRICIANKFAFLCLVNFSLPYLYKPSNKNLLFTLLFTFLGTFMLAKTPLEIVVMGQLWFLYTQLRAPSQKLLITVVAAITFILPTTGILEYMIADKTPTTRYGPSTPKST